MLHRLKVFAIAIAALGFSLTAAVADEALLDGVRPFMCDGEAIVFFETDNGWVISTDPTAEVKPTDKGWRYENTLSGDVWYLREENRNSWVIDGLSEDGHFKLDCIDLADSISQVVTIIKPRLDEGILDIEAQLAKALQELQLTKDKLYRSQAIISEQQPLPSGEDYMLATQRVERLCIWMKTYRHLDVLDKSFPFGDEQYKLCN